MQQIAGERAQSQQTPSTFARSNLVVSALAIVALMSGWGIFLYFGIGSLIKSGPPRNKPNSQNTNSATEVAALAVPYRDAEEAFVLNLQRGELQGRVEATRAFLADAKGSIHQFQARIATLRTSDTGHRLAVPDAARKIDFLIRYLEQVDLDHAENEINGVEQSMSATQQPLVNFGLLVQKLIDVETHLEKSNQQCEAANNAVDQLLNEYHTAQPITLNLALQQLERSNSVAVAMQVNAKLASDRAIQVAQLQTETDRQAKLTSELEEAKRKEELLREQSRVEIDSFDRSMQDVQRDLAEQKSHAITQMQAAYPSVRTLLLPFTTPGYRQPAASGNLEITSTKEALSYAGLLRIRALEDSDKGLSVLFILAQSFDGNRKFNDRPQGDFPVHSNFSDIENAGIRLRIQTAQSFLREHGEAMVEAGLLSP